MSSSQELGPLGSYSVASLSRAATKNDLQDFSGSVWIGFVIVRGTDDNTGEPSTVSTTAARWDVNVTDWTAIRNHPVLRAPSATWLLAETPGPKTFALGPIGEYLYVNGGNTVLTAGGGAASGVFYINGIEPRVGDKRYWEYTLSTTSIGLGGFGVGSNSTRVAGITATQSPGKSDNPGCLLFKESSVWSIWNNGTQTVVTVSGTPLRVGVAVEVTAVDSLAVQWYLDGALLNETPQVWTFSGPFWIPVLAARSTATVYRIEDRV
jgi:hypothetical protein